ncbi:MAG: PACE efflux transporter [Comamonas sp.]
MSKNASAMAPAPSLSAASASPAVSPATATPPRATGLQGAKRRVVFVGLYELIAIIVSSLLFMATGQDSGSSGVMAVAASTIAILWNITFNWLFERWELRQTKKGRSLLRRMVHAVGFEGGIAAMLIPLMAWWFEITLWQAVVMEAGLLVFFMVYTFVFNWAFDRIFGLPASAQAQPVATS